MTSKRRRIGPGQGRAKDAPGKVVRESAGVADLSGYIADIAEFERGRKQIKAEGSARYSSVRQQYEDFKCVVTSCPGFYYMFGNVKRDIMSDEILRVLSFLNTKWDDISAYETKAVCNFIRYVTNRNKERQRNKTPGRRGQKILVSEGTWKFLRNLAKKHANPNAPASTLPSGK